MTNREKYATLEERVMAFRKFCAEKECNKCPMHQDLSEREGWFRGFDVCAIKWLDLDVEEEKPLNCPCCGAKVHTVQSIEHFGYKVVCERCGLQTGGFEKTPGEAVALWNRRVK